LGYIILAIYNTNYIITLIPYGILYDAYYVTLTICDTYYIILLHVYTKLYNIHIHTIDKHMHIHEHV